ncbi:hypothetical protein FHR83_004053 [Actinoplanes campanulatus]|uniref:Ig-like domain (Group 3) n=1 Tax=Actinoplanes campanulatus TaxID=113559 RepID=A0A7W5FFA0_9ACTN|nr:hypothetical protein [Actinoplanes campanulatus]MBB3096383.1 hypothetical protein [Actinoplanes campanulatus]GGN18688.1 hypothetical protein GCM10010109_31870 [Actinoplanes campanulatus]GID38449.1 hypothetical protein Aca09nite_49550 [Actinoplanes campanulatus]
MRTIRLTMLTMTLATAVVLTSSPAVAAPKKPVRITFAASATAAVRGSTVTLTGRAHYNATGNKARVDVYFARTGAGYRLLTSTTANAHGNFRKTVTATTTGMYKAVYRGNTKRKRATAADALTVYINQTVTKTIFSHSEEGVDCGAPRPNACTFAGPTITIADTPITVTGKRACATPKAGMTMAFTDSPTNTLPPRSPDNSMSGPGWVTRSYLSPGTLPLPTPPSTTGHFYVSVGASPFENTAAICDWSVVATQPVTERVTV